eukprot:2328482-Rhodomonas_salina.2
MSTTNTDAASISTSTTLPLTLAQHFFQHVHVGTRSIAQRRSPRVQPQHDEFGLEQACSLGHCVCLKVLAHDIPAVVFVVDLSCPPVLQHQLQLLRWAAIPRSMSARSCFLCSTCQHALALASSASPSLEQHSQHMVCKGLEESSRHLVSRSISLFQALKRAVDACSRLMAASQSKSMNPSASIPAQARGL